MAAGVDAKKGSKVVSFPVMETGGEDSDYGVAIPGRGGGNGGGVTGERLHAARHRKRNRDYDRSAKLELSTGSYIAPHLNDTTVSLGPAVLSPSISSSSGFTQQTDSLPIDVRQQPITPLKVETTNRFLSLFSKPIQHHELSAAQKSSGTVTPRKRSSVVGSNRQEFYRIFTAMQKSQSLSNEKSERSGSIGVQSYSRERSVEEQRYQNTTGDLIWLELQAWFAGRDPIEQDRFITEARETVRDTIKDILLFRFQKDPSSRRHSLTPSSMSRDASVASDLTDHMDPDIFFDAHESLPNSLQAMDISGEFMDMEFDGSCVDVYDTERIRAMTQALEKVKTLLDKLDVAEQYYASSKMFRIDHPAVGNEDFQARVKCLCMWYNLTEQLRSKIDVLGNVLLGLGASRKLRWPSFMDQNDSVLSDEVPASPIHSRDSSQLDTSALEQQPAHTCKVRFKLTEEEANKSSPSDSTNSTDSGLAQTGPDNLNTPPTAASTLRQTSALSTSSSGGFSDSDAEGVSPYRKYVEKYLKTKGLRKTMSTLHRLIRGPLRRAKIALEKPIGEQEIPPDFGGKHHPHLEERYSSHPSPSQDEKELSLYGTWNEEFIKMNLPSFRAPYLFLCRIPLDIIHECLKIRLEQKPQEPSELSIRQLMRECKEALRLAVLERQSYISRVKAAIYDVEHDREFLEEFELLMEEFDQNVTLTLEVYLSYLQNFVTMMQSDSSLLISTYQKNLLEEEWNFIKQVCPHIPDGESFSGNTFCQMACGMLKAIGDYLSTEIDEVVNKMFVYPSSDDSEDDTATRHQIYEACRGFQSTFHEARERAIKALSFAKTLRKDLEVAAEFTVSCPPKVLIDKMAATDHVRVVAPHSSQHLIFISGSIRDRQDHILQLLDMHCGSDQQTPKENSNPGYLVLMKWSMVEGGASEVEWQGDTIYVKPTAETTISLSQIEVEGVLLVAPNAALLRARRNKFEKVMGEVISLKHDQRATSHRIAFSLGQVKQEALALRENISQELSKVEEKCDVSGMGIDLESNDKEALSRRTREILHQCYKFGFEYHREMDRLITGEVVQRQLAKGIVDFSKQWLNFVQDRCERGRGVIPRWAKTGIDFIYHAANPNYTKYLTDDEFMTFSSLVIATYEHVVGDTPTDRKSRSPTGSPISDSDRPFVRSTSRSRVTSPTPRKPRAVSTVDPPVMGHPLEHNKKTKSEATMLGGDLDKLNMPPPQSPYVPRRRSDGKKSSTVDEPDTPDVTFKVPPYAHLPWPERVAKSIETLERLRDGRRTSEGYIGHVLDTARREDRIHIKSKTVNFSWQRGVKIGQGHFGKVYTAINNETGDIMAMKEIQLLPNDHKTLRNVADELRIFESIHHKHLINHYGVEVHREEMLIFMEYCPEGTLEELVESTESGLEETSCRRYTKQLMEAVAVLHENGIVHRDIKGANIFLTDEMQNLKLGDFGCAVKIKAHTTMPGELQGFVGTQAYMAPEVFTKNMSEGHGRAADIWSVGCVVVEMVTGKRPWHELESNYQIMFKVGMGYHPEFPDRLSKEGKDFLSLCFQHDPKLRSSAADLLCQSFLAVFDEDENQSLPMFASLAGLGDIHDHKYKLVRKSSAF